MRVVAPVLAVVVVVLGAAAFVATHLSGSPPPAVATAAAPAPIAAPAAAPTPAVAASPVQPPPAASRAFMPEAMPFVDDKVQLQIRRSYLPAQRSKALALSAYARYGWASQQPDDESARKLAIENCTSTLKRDIPDPPRRGGCSLYAVNDEVVWSLRRRQFRRAPGLPQAEPCRPRHTIPHETPLVSDGSRKSSVTTYLPAPPSKAMAMGPPGFIIHVWNRSSELAAMRSALETCGHLAQAPCFIYAVGDELVVRLPRLSRITGVLVVEQLAGLSDADRKAIETTYLPDADWRALAIGRNGRIGLARQLASEQEAINQALRSCTQAGGQDCDLAAVGPFKVSMR